LKNIASLNRQIGFLTLGGEEKLKDKITPQIKQITQIIKIS
jgi:hypothetical protein